MSDNDPQQTPRRVDVDTARASFERAVAEHEQEFGVFFLAKLLGFEISYPEDRCVVRFAVHDFMFNPQGSLHGGIIATAMDISMGHLMRHRSGAGTTLEMKTQYLRAVPGGVVRAVGSVLQAGRSVWFLQSHLLDEADRPLAFATSTWKLLRTPA